MLSFYRKYKMFTYLFFYLIITFRASNCHYKYLWVKVKVK